MDNTKSTINKSSSVDEKNNRNRSKNLEKCNEIKKQEQNNLNLNTKKHLVEEEEKSNSMNIYNNENGFPNPINNKQKNTPRALLEQFKDYIEKTEKQALIFDQMTDVMKNVLNDLNSENEKDSKQVYIFEELIEKNKKDIYEEMKELFDKKDRLLAEKNQLENLSVSEKHNLISKWTEELDNIKETVKNLLEKEKDYDKEIEIYLSEYEKTVENVKKMDQLSKSLDEELQYLNRKNQILCLNSCSYKLNQPDTLELLRQRHNIIQEGKGNIRVFCRVRPPLPNEIKEISKHEDEYILYPQENTIIFQILNQLSNKGKNNMNFYPKEEFNFDHIFNPSHTQEDIFKEISQLVQSALDGYKVCIFAYGQTGSGKTYTMQGEKDEKRGLIPRSLEKIFEEKKLMELMDWKFSIEVSVMEIYISQVRDLLLAPPNNIVKDLKPEKFCSIEIFTINDFYKLMDLAAERRVVAETQCNEKSSRSHCIYQVKINGSNLRDKNLKRYGALNLIDLAGSERIHNSKAEGERKKEAISINKSLLTLKSVIIGLVNKNTHVPYRDSTLTFILQNYLGEGSKALMFANISPLFSNHSENKSTLGFASEVNICKANFIDDWS